MPRFHCPLQICTCLAALVLVGCASPADPDAMVPQDAKIGRTHRGSVDVTVVGGRETNPMLESDVSNEDLQKALTTSLTRYGVFSQVIQNGGTDYRLDVAVVDLKKPLAGFDMTVTAKLMWRLTNNHTERVLWDDTTTTPFKATVGDAFAGVRRLQLADEGAIREGIKAGLEHVGKMSF
jgi:hypothetical protein